jgi:hypothetical protein
MHLHVLDLSLFHSLVQKQEAARHLLASLSPNLRVLLFSTLEGRVLSFLPTLVQSYSAGMSKSNGSSAPASQNTGKQSTLLGFFTKNPAGKTGSGASQARLATPATPSSATTENGSDGLVASSSSGVKPAKPNAIPSKKQPASTPASESIDLSSDGVEEQPPRSSSSSALKAKALSNPSSSLAHLKSKPAVNSASQPALKLPTPPLTSEGDDNGASTSASASGALTSASEMDVDDDEDEPMKRRPSGVRRGFACH